MIQCLVNYIGLKDVQTSPSSGLYVNDLPGITTEQFELSRSLEIAAIAEEWTSLEARAIRGFEQDLKFRLRKYFKNHSVISSATTGYIDDNVLVDHGAGVYSGVLIDFYGQSPNLKISIENVKLNLVAGATFNIKIFDVNTGTELYTSSVTGVAGINTFKVQQEYSVFDHNRLFIAYDTVEPYKMYDVPAPWVVSAQKISTGSTVLNDNLQSDGTGLSVSYNVKCGIDEFVCNRLSIFQEPFLYRLGIEFLNQSKYSDRFNRYTLLGEDKRNEMMTGYKESYDNIISSVFHDMKVNDDGVCFICNKAINQKVLIP